MIPHHSDRGTSKNPMNPCLEWVDATVFLIEHDLRDLIEIIDTDLDHLRRMHTIYESDFA